MTPPTPTVKSYMTPSPHTVDFTCSMPEAQRMMRVHNLRHLPVLERGALCGIVTERDLLLAETLIGFDTRKVPVTDAMTRTVFSVKATDLLVNVAAAMGKDKYGCAVVMERETVVGILTTTDICRALADVLTPDASARS